MKQSKRKLNGFGRFIKGVLNERKQSIIAKLEGEKYVWKTKDNHIKMFVNNALDRAIEIVKEEL